MTQTRHKLARDAIRNQQQTIHTHEQVGKEVRDAIKRIGGDLPEHVPAAEPIKEVEKRVKKSRQSSNSMNVMPVVRRRKNDRDVANPMTGKPKLELTWPARRTGAADFSGRSGEAV